MGTTVLLVLIGLAVALIAAGLVLSWRQSSVRPPSPSPGPAGLSGPAGGELQAAPTSEAVEDLVNQRLAAIPELAGSRVDFGTAPDGSLEIWIEDQRYASVDEIRDPRIRQAVQDAVASYNK